MKIPKIKTSHFKSNIVEKNPKNKQKKPKDWGLKKNPKSDK